MDRFETWLAALFLVAPTLADAGLDPATGADRVLMASAQKRGIAVVGLETTEEQLGYFDKLPEAAQRSLLSAVIDRKSVVSGKSVSVRVDVVGRRIIKKKNKNKTHCKKQT